MRGYRFNFEWDAKEDTYEARLHEGSLLFGRGVRAGVDYRAQREAAAHHEQSYLSRERSKRGQMTSAADVQADILRAQRASQVDDDPVRVPVLSVGLHCWSAHDVSSKA